jgi:lipoate-protein ligase A
LSPNKSAPGKSGRLLFFRLPWTSPPRNLAAEEYLLDEGAAADASFLLVYENSESLVIGKNQNPWKDVAPAVLRSGEPPFFRRVSGGGAVWQGPGNLNFAFIADAGNFSKEDSLDFVRRALLRLGLRIERTARGDLTAAGKKVSGSALCYRRGRVLHHGTLLVDAPLERLKNSLAARAPGDEAPQFLIETRAVASVSMPVANLKDLSPSVTPALCERALLEEALAVYEKVDVPAQPGLMFPARTLQTLESRRTEWAWLYGLTPPFVCRAGETLLTVKDGIITSARPSSAAPLEGKPFSLELVRGLSSLA